MPDTFTPMRRTLTSIVGATALATILTACGDSGDGGTASKPDGCSPVDSTVNVGGLDKLQFDAKQYEAKPGCVEIIFKNDGTVAHTLLVKGKPGFKLAIGDEDIGTLELEAGTYKIYCDIAGHEAAGMVAELTLS